MRVSGPVRPVTLDDGAHAQRPGPRHGGDEQPEVANAAAHLAEWLPVCARALDPETLAAVEPHVRSAAAAAQPRTVSDVHRILRVAFDHTLWTLDELGFLDPATVWHPENGRVWVDEVNADRSVDWRQEAGRTLAQIGRAVNPRFWPAGTESLTKTGPAAVYDEPGEAALQHAAILKGAPGRADELAVTGFSMGGGLNGPQIALAMPSDVIHLGGGRVGTWVRGRHARLAPIRDDYTALVLRAVEFAGDERFIRATSRNAVYIAAERVMVHGFGHLELARARSTWLKAHLVAGTPLAALRVIAGPLSLNTLSGLLSPASEEFSAEAAAVEGLRA